jgi:hypothetical protein
VLGLKELLAALELATLVELGFPYICARSSRAWPSAT